MSKNINPEIIVAFLRVIGISINNNMGNDMKIKGHANLNENRIVFILKINNNKYRKIVSKTTHSIIG